MTMEQMISNYRLSIVLIFFSACLTATMMRPSGSAVLTLFINLGVLFLLRWVSHIEGRTRPPL